MLFQRGFEEEKIFDKGCHVFQAFTSNIEKTY